MNRYDLAHIEPEEIKCQSIYRDIVKKFAEPDFVSEEIVSERLVELDKDDSYEYSLSANETKYSPTLDSLPTGSITSKS
ncbi:MAG: hypothetical protein MZV64_21050 [Ignavibacteriales bacterium]|nr:hypothetical protein [Ignavibacteriales bacterium]